MRLTLCLIILLLTTVTSSQAPVYRRADWPHWIGSCPDTRQRVLMDESRVEPTLSPDGCRVLAGEWLSWYDGELVTTPDVLDIDHMVPLAHAHRSGAAAWSRDRKRAYANALDAPEHLAAVTARANRQKSDLGPDEWRPSRQAAWCRYASEWMLVKLRWGLTATDAELLALREMVARCSQLADGTAAAPSRTYASDTDLGFFRNGANEECFAAGGVSWWCYDTH